MKRPSPRRSTWLLLAPLLLFAACAKVVVDGAGPGGGAPTGTSSGTGAPGCGGLPCYTLAEAQPVGSGAQDLLLIDCNGDAHLDIIVANGESSTISVLVGHGDGTFDAQETYAAGDHPWMLEGGDFDEDGNGDLAVANFVNGANVLMGDGACGFGAPIPVLDEDPLGQYSSGAHTIAVGDLDADGHDDLVAHATGPGGETAFFALLFGLGGGAFEPPVTLPVGTSTSDILLRDLDADGTLDIVGTTHWLGSGEGAFVHVVRGEGNRSFAPAVGIPIGFAPDGFAIADFDGDGVLDVVTAGGPSFESSVVSLLRGDGKAGFQAEITFPVGDGDAAGIAAGDLDGDGFLDVVVCIGDKNAVAILRGGPGGQLGPAVKLTTGNNPVGNDRWEPYYVALGDLDEDGVLDIAATNFVGKVSLLLSH